MATRLRDVLERVDPKYKESVENICRLWRVRVQNHLKELMKLSMSQGSQIKFVVTEAYDLGLLETTLNEQEHEAFLLFHHKPILERLQADLRKLKGVLPKFGRHIVQNQNDSLDLHMVTIERTERIVDELYQKAPQDDEFIKKVRSVNPHIFGVYRSGESGGTIELYWTVLGLCAERWNVDLEALTLIVLSHEYTHAYTHLGVDANEQSWHKALFDKANTFIIEGLAEYFSHQFLREQGEYRPGWLDTYEIQFRTSPPQYQDFRTWGDVSPEAVRYAMLQARRKVSGLNYEVFKNYVTEGHQKLDKVHS